MGAREIAKAVALGVATVLVAPALLSFLVRSRLLGRDRALQGSAQALSLVPGLPGQYVRRAFLRFVLDAFHPSATIEFGTLFSRAGARIGANAYVGPRCHLGLVDIGADVLLAAGVHVPSGARTHGTADPAAPIREQAGEVALVRIGRGSWIGSGAVVMADVGEETVVGAGAVVTKPLPDRVIAGGVPAKVIRTRAEPTPEAAEKPNPPA